MPAAGREAVGTAGQTAVESGRNICSFLKGKPIHLINNKTILQFNHPFKKNRKYEYLFVY